MTTLEALVVASVPRAVSYYVARASLHRLRAETTKAKRADELPIHADLADLLRQAKPEGAAATDRVFLTVPTLKSFRGYQGTDRCYLGDLYRARIAFSDDQGRTVDLHALRTTFVSWLGLYGVDPRAQVMLARHAPQGITLRHCQDFGLFDLWAEIAKLPPIRSNPEAEGMRATGTCDIGLGAVVRPVGQNSGRQGVNPSIRGRIVRESFGTGNSGETLENKGFRTKTEVSGP